MRLLCVFLYDFYMMFMAFVPAAWTESCWKALRKIDPISAFWRAHGNGAFVGRAGTQV